MIKKIVTLLISLILLVTPVVGDSVLEQEYFGGNLQVEFNQEPSVDEASESPTHGATGEYPPVTLEIDVSDPEGDNFNVTFYDNSDDSVIGVDSCGGNRTASVQWTELSYSTLYEWYVIAEECPHQGCSNNTNTSSVFNFTTIMVSEFGEVRYFGGKMEFDITSSFEKEIWNSGYDYFCWKGDNGTLSDVGSVIANFDESDEFVAVWNASNWTTNEGCWIKYYGDGSGTDASVNQLDVIYCYLTDGAGQQTITMTTSNAPSCDRTVDLHYLGSDVNKGYNYTCYCCNIKNLQNISDIASNIPLQDGEVLSWWDNETQNWRAWIEGVSHTDYDYTINVTSPIFETKIHTNVSMVIGCP